MDQINTNNIHCRTPLFYATTWITRPFRMEASLLDQQSSYFHLKWHMYGPSLSIIPFENSLVLYVFHGRQYHTRGGTEHKWSSDDVRMICFKRLYDLWPVLLVRCFSWYLDNSTLVVSLTMFLINYCSMVENEMQNLLPILQEEEESREPGQQIA